MLDRDKDPRDEPVDERLLMQQEADQMSMNSDLLAQVMAAEHQALVNEGINGYYAAVMVGHRYKMG